MVVDYIGTIIGSHSSTPCYAQMTLAADYGGLGLWVSILGGGLRNGRLLLQETKAVMHINKIELEVLNCSRSMGLLVPPTR